VPILRCDGRKGIRRPTIGGLELHDLAERH
jgi:hypothetical protein